MHPIERLRYVARAEGAGPTLLAIEAAQALAGFSDDPSALVTACRRLIDRHPEVGTVWWVAARALMAPDPRAALYECAAELEADPIAAILAAALPDAAAALVIGWPEQTGAALSRRADLEVRAARAGGDGEMLARRLDRAGGDAVAIDDAGVGPAAADSDLVIIEALALGGEGLIATTGSRAAAAVAASEGVPVWAVVGVGRVLSPGLWTALVGRLEQQGDPWDLPVEVVPLTTADRFWGPAGECRGDEIARRGDCPSPPELSRGAMT